MDSSDETTKKIGEEEAVVEFIDQHPENSKTVVDDESRPLTPVSEDAVLTENGFINNSKNGSVDLTEITQTLKDEVTKQLKEELEKIKISLSHKEKEKEKPKKKKSTVSSAKRKKKTEEPEIVVRRRAAPTDWRKFEEEDDEKDALPAKRILIRRSKPSPLENMEYDDDDPYLTSHSHPRSVLYRPSLKHSMRYR